MRIKMYNSEISLVLAPVAFIISLAASSNCLEGSPEAGNQIYASCIACHSPERNRTGPRHCGLFGRKSGSVSGFEYSTAMREASIIWNTETLDRFLESPLTIVPGTTMGFAGIKDDKKRQDLIAYLKSVSDSPGICVNNR